MVGTMRYATAILVAVLLMVHQGIQKVSAYPGNLQCQGEEWVAGDLFPGGGAGDMGDVYVFTQGGTDSTCKISILGGPSAITPCASYVVQVNSGESVGQKLSTSAGILTGHPEIETEEQNNRCRHRYSQTVTKYVYRAVNNAASQKFYAVCGKTNGPIYVTSITVPQSGLFPESGCSAACVDGTGVTACYPDTPAPTPEPPGTAINDRLQSSGSRIGINELLSLWSAIVVSLACVLVVMS